MNRKEAIFRPFGKKDLGFLALLAVVSVVCVVVLYSGESSVTGTSVVVTVDGVETGRYSLKKEQRVEITGAGGKISNILAIADGHAWMAEADCPDRTCVRQHRISKSGESIVCLPNRVVVTVEGGDTEIDAITN